MGLVSTQMTSILANRVSLMELCRAFGAFAILVFWLGACSIKPLSFDEQTRYFSSQFIAWQLSAATKCLARAQSYRTPPSVEQTAKWRAYGQVVFQKYPFDGTTSLDRLIDDMAATQFDLSPNARSQLDRACAIVPSP
jgi:hypothetical protein